MRFLFLAFLLVPVLEMWLLIEVGSRIGALPTIGLVLLTAVIGVQLLRQQGIETLLRANRKLESGQVPASELAEGFALAIGGALLLTPGFVTDAVGFSCLLPLSRRWLIRHGFARISVSSFSVPGDVGGGQNSAAGSVYEGEFQEEPGRQLPPDKTLNGD